MAGRRTVPSSQFWGGDGTDCVSVMLPGLAVKVTLMKELFALQ